MLEKKVEVRTKKLAEANKALVRSNKDLEDFAYIASHDLKEPLRGIGNTVQFMMEDYEKEINSDMKLKMEKILSLGKCLENLISTLLYYSRVGRAELSVKKMDMGELIREVVSSLQMRLDQEGARIILAEKYPEIRLDVIRIREVYQNLITNALKYNESDPKLIELGANLDQSPPVLFVKDNGIGIKAHHQEKIFTIFKRLHGKNKYGGGTGAGMTIIKKIVERHGGSIWLESEPGKGTTFFFTLESDSSTKRSA